MVLLDSQFSLVESLLIILLDHRATQWNALKFVSLIKQQNIERAYKLLLEPKYCIIVDKFDFYFDTHKCTDALPPKHEASKHAFY